MESFYLSAATELTMEEGLGTKPIHSIVLQNTA